jgi:hypothetical protein
MLTNNKDKSITVTTSFYSKKHLPNVVDHQFTEGGVGSRGCGDDAEFQSIQDSIYIHTGWAGQDYRNSNYTWVM